MSALRSMGMSLSPPNHFGLWHVDCHQQALHRLFMANQSAASERAREILIGAIAANADRAAFIALFEFYAPRIKAQAMRFGLEESAADDVVQDAMLAVWRRASQFDPARGSASAWVFTIATNARLDRIRRDKHLMHSAELVDNASTPLVEPDESRPDQARLSAIVSGLPEEQRLIVEMSFYADISHGDISQQLGIPLGTVKSRIRLAMARLRQALGERS